MFLERCVKLGLLAHQPDTNIIAPLPLAVRKKLIFESVNCLSQRSAVPNHTNTLTSFPHVKWYMELIGHGLSLPIEDVTIINECINVYKAWLLEGGDLAPQELKALSRCFGSSLLFQPRKSYDSSPTTPGSSQPADQLSSEVLVTTHINLCRHILLMVLTASQQQVSFQSQSASNSTSGPTQQPFHLDFSRETWMVLIKVLLGCADRLLSEPCGNIQGRQRRSSHLDGNLVGPMTATPTSSAGSGSDKDKSSSLNPGGAGGTGNGGEVKAGPAMGDALCDFLSRVLIEVWLRSEDMNVELWACLKNQYEKWTHRVEIVKNWSAVILGLSNRVLQLLYGEGEGTKYTSVLFPAVSPFNLDLSEKFTVYAWHRFIYIIGNVNSIENSDNFYVAIKGISRVVDAFLAVGTKKEFNPEVTAPDGNTILHMFAHWLFEAVTRRSPETSSNTHIYHYELRKFIHNGSGGIRVLVNDFSVGLKRVLLSTDKTGYPITVVPMEELRKGCLRIIGSIIGVLGVFGEVKMKNFVILERGDYSDKIRIWYKEYGRATNRTASETRDLDSTPPPSATFKSLKPYYLDLLLTTLSSEHTPANLKMTLHVLSCFCVEEIDTCPGAVVLVLSVDVVIAFSTYIDGLFAEDNVVTHQQMIIRAFDGMIRWAIIGGWMLRDKECTARVNASLCRGVSILDKDHEFSVVTGGVPPVTTPTHVKPSSSSGNLMGDSHHPKIPSPLSPNLPSATTSMSEKTAALADRLATFAGNVTSALNEKKLGKRRPTKTKFGRSNTLSSSPLVASLAAAVGVGSALEKDKLERLTASPSSSGTNINITAPSPTIPTVSSTAGVSTFAKLTAESAVKSAAEIALSQLLNHLGNFPPRGARFGASRVSTLFDELAEVKRILRIRDLRRRDSIFGSGRNSYIRYFVYDNRILMAFVEQPEWAIQPGSGGLPYCDEGPDFDCGSDESLDQKPKNPKLLLILRDATGKFSWVCKHMYLEEKGKKTPATATKEEKSVKVPLKDDSSISTGTPASSGLGVPERPKRPQSAPLGGRKASPVKLREQSLTLHDSDGNLPEAIQANEMEEAASSKSSVAVSAEPKSGEYHVRPRLPPYIPPNSSVIDGPCFNDSAIPKFSELLDPNSEEGKRFEEFKKELDRKIQLENERYNSIDENPLKADISVKPAPPINRYDVNAPCALFRQFLSHLGYLALDAREKLKPMIMSEAFFKDLERMDALPERECFAVSVLYAKDCQTSINDIVRPKAVSSDFHQFLTSIGAPISLDKHVGYKGNLSAAICSNTSYFATRTAETLFNTPYVMKPQAASVDGTDAEKVKSLFTSANADNQVLILWIENMIDIHNVVKRVTSQLTPNVVTVIVVHPQLPNKNNSLYNIRMMTAAGAVEDNLILGPLTDGMVVSKRSLGNLVRMTATSAHLTARILKPGYRRPQTARRLMIEEICSRHKLNCTMAG
ncbi:hypothetical protein BCR33DRAFT_796550 [Rhizoclosmatium globosum]|uniref:Rap-GAP domain-containing protein n=1 Tax=Rhizoclosmatium globosum TaxID=329046 RepID=A0A1Y2AM16_9FUNG|nr:hypothetical protein BCR33DRAFT_796550 [Rhizoclosmatium globosum]|eukprot:ORY23340.1 hypothetical protein BCR33DRAFT_796550 [Rhizoclosmatium globosum]